MHFLCLGKSDYVNQIVEQRLTEHLAVEFMGPKRTKRAASYRTERRYFYIDGCGK